MPIRRDEASLQHQSHIRQSDAGWLPLALAAKNTTEHRAALAIEAREAPYGDKRRTGRETA